MKLTQIYSNYTQEDFEVWKILFDRQFENLQQKGSSKYLIHLNEIKDVLNPNKIPDFNEINELLASSYGWQIEVVKGLIPVADFFELLAERKFCSSTWLRSRAQLDYLEEPDMFHDIFGHIPLLMNKELAEFTHQLGVLGAKYIDHPEIILQLERLYWYTIEFGLIKENGNTKVYGAGLISSFGETNHIISPEEEDSNVIITNFEMQEVLKKVFTTNSIQSEYVIISDLQVLFDSIITLDSYFQKTSH